MEITEFIFYKADNIHRHENKVKSGSEIQKCR